MLNLTWGRQRDLRVVDDPGTVESHAGHDTPLHQVDDHRTQPDLDRVGSHAEQDGLVLLVGLADSADDLLQVRRPENRRQPFHELP